MQDSRVLVRVTLLFSFSRLVPYIFISRDLIIWLRLSAGQSVITISVLTAFLRSNTSKYHHSIFDINHDEKKSRVKYFVNHTDIRRR